MACTREQPLPIFPTAPFGQSASRPPSDLRSAVSPPAYRSIPGSRVYARDLPGVPYLYQGSLWRASSSPAASSLAESESETDLALRDQFRPAPISEDSQPLGWNPKSLSERQQWPYA